MAWEGPVHSKNSFEKIQAIYNGKCTPITMQSFALAQENPPAQEQWKTMKKTMRGATEPSENPGECLRPWKKISEKKNRRITGRRGAEIQERSLKRQANWRGTRTGEKYSRTGITPHRTSIKKIARRREAPGADFRH